MSQWSLLRKLFQLLVLKSGCEARLEANRCFKHFAASDGSDHLRSYRTENDVSCHFAEMVLPLDSGGAVAWGMVLNLKLDLLHPSKDCLASPLKYMPGALMPLVEGVRIDTVEMAHAA